MALLARTDERLHIPLAMDNTTAGTRHRPYTTDQETNAPPSEETDPVGVHPGFEALMLEGNEFRADYPLVRTLPDPQTSFRRAPWTTIGVC